MKKTVIVVMLAMLAFVGACLLTYVDVVASPLPCDDTATSVPPTEAPPPPPTDIPPTDIPPTEVPTDVVVPTDTVVTVIVSTETSQPSPTVRQTYPVHKTTHKAHPPQGGLVSTLPVPDGSVVEISPKTGGVVLRWFYGVLMLVGIGLVGIGVWRWLHGK